MAGVPPSGSAEIPAISSLSSLPSHSSAPSPPPPTRPALHPLILAPSSPCRTPPSPVPAAAEASLALAVLGRNWVPRWVRPILPSSPESGRSPEVAGATGTGTGKRSAPPPLPPPSRAGGGRRPCGWTPQVSDPVSGPLRLSGDALGKYASEVDPARVRLNRWAGPVAPRR